MSKWWGTDPPNPKLDVDALGLEGRDLEIATIIAEETEAQREREFAELPPLSEQELDTLIPQQYASLLTKPEPITVRQARRSGVDEALWDDLLLRGRTHTRAAERANVGHAALIEFVLAKCHPSNWSAMFWYGAWIKEALSPKRSPEAVAEMIEQAKLEAARQHGKTGSDKRWEAYRKAKKFTQEEWAKQKANYSNRKAPFARAMIARIKAEYEGVDDITERTITEDWLKGLTPA